MESCSFGQEVTDGGSRYPAGADCETNPPCRGLLLMPTGLHKPLRQPPIGTLSAPAVLVSLFGKCPFPQQQALASNTQNPEKSPWLNINPSHASSSIGTFRADDPYKRGLNTTLLLHGKDYSSFQELTYKGMLATAKGYAYIVATMLRFMEVNNPNMSKFEGLAKELESTRAGIASALTESEKKRKGVEEAAVKAENGRLKEEDVLKNKECEL